MQLTYLWWLVYTWQLCCFAHFHTVLQHSQKMSDLIQLGFLSCLLFFNICLLLTDVIHCIGTHQSERTSIWQKCPSHWHTFSSFVLWLAHIRGWMDALRLSENVSMVTSPTLKYFTWMRSSVVTAWCLEVHKSCHKLVIRKGSHMRSTFMFFSTRSTCTCSYRDILDPALVLVVEFELQIETSYLPWQCCHYLYCWTMTTASNSVPPIVMLLH